MPSSSSLEKYKFNALLRSRQQCITLIHLGYILEPISIHLCRLDHKDLNPAALSKHIPHQKVSHHHQRRKPSRAPLDNRLLFCLRVPSLADLQELVPRGAGDYNKRVLNVHSPGMH